jgi:hypothetical protein
MVENAIERQTSALEKYGPHILWTHQMPANEDVKATMERIKAAEARRKRAVIELGERRRRRRERD